MRAAAAPRESNRNTTVSVTLSGGWRQRIRDYRAGVGPGVASSLVIARFDTRRAWSEGAYSRTVAASTQPTVGARGRVYIENGPRVSRVHFTSSSTAYHCAQSVLDLEREEREKMKHFESTVDYCLSS